MGVVSEVQLVKPDGTSTADAAGNPGVTLATRIAGEDIPNDRLVVEQRNTYFNQAGTTTGLNIKSGAGFLHTLTINTPAPSAVITLYDSLTAAGTVIATITLPGTLLNVGPIPAIYDVAFTTGLSIKIATGAADVTVSYR
jgi:hypothetical protein